ncbi:AfsR/SARP family transcriptional regulator [Fodinicola feengrottensis]|uniref:Bacterial transcriptional activator domain-containing protein n=1 Tax=Fodinicola feengrottensis TaxID=435914 RepID=A0ABN2HEU4_9ACTN|nr:BTAD domain-containing protein [Fodinicola feengrottensis]
MNIKRTDNPDTCLDLTGSEAIALARLLAEVADGYGAAIDVQEAARTGWELLVRRATAKMGAGVDRTNYADLLERLSSRATERTDAEDALDNLQVDAAKKSPDSPYVPSLPRKSEVQSMNIGYGGQLAWSFAFGRPRIVVDDTLIVNHIRKNTRRLVLWLSIHRDGGTMDDIREDLLPHLPKAQALVHIRSAIGMGRDLFRTATGHKDRKFITFTKATSDYRLDSEDFSVDLWTFQDFLIRAEKSDDINRRRDYLEAAVGLYRGELASGNDAAWILPAREWCRRQTRDAYTQLADIWEPSNTAYATENLKQARDLDPTDEEITRRLMRLHAQRERPDLVGAAMTKLKESLDDLEVTPSSTTIEAHRIALGGGNSD